MTSSISKLKEKQDKVFNQMAQILGAISSPVRIKLIHFLSQAPLTVEVLANKTDQSVANTSMHLRKMLTENVVAVETAGQKRLYSLHPSLFLFWEQIQDFIQNLEPNLNMLDQNSEEELSWHLSMTETMNLAKKGQIVFLDVRPDDEIELSSEMKLKNYLHLSMEKLPNNLKLIPRSKKIIVLCRGRMCALSIYTVNYLRENKYDAYRLNQSWFSLREKLIQEDA